MYSNVKKVSHFHRKYREYIYRQVFFYQLILVSTVHSCISGNHVGVHVQVI